MVEAITFEELVQHGRESSTDTVGRTPWSFNYAGYPITHENDRRYLIPTLEGIMGMTPDDMLITGINGEIYPCKVDIFEKTYEIVVE